MTTSTTQTPNDIAQNTERGTSIPNAPSVRVADSTNGQALGPAWAFKKLVNAKIPTLILTKEWTDKKTGEVKRFNAPYHQWWAVWKAIKERFADANYAIREWDGKPYLKTDEGLFVSVTVWLYEGGVQHTVPYPVDGDDSQDITDSIWRALAKACAMHGCGIGAYLKREDDARPPAKADPKEPPHVGLLLEAYKKWRDAGLGHLEFWTRVEQAADYKFKSMNWKTVKFECRNLSEVQVNKALGALRADYKTLQSDEFENG